MRTPPLIALAKRQPGKLTCASLGQGTAAHLTVEMFKSLAGIELLHVPYKGSTPAMTAMLSGEANAMIDGLPTSLTHIRSDKMRALAVGLDGIGDIANPKNLLSTSKKVMTFFDVSGK